MKSRGERKVSLFETRCRSLVDVAVWSGKVATMQRE